MIWVRDQNALVMLSHRERKTMIPSAVKPRAELLSLLLAVSPNYGRGGERQEKVQNYLCCADEREKREHLPSIVGIQA